MEFEPIYQAGFHEITIDKMDEIFVQPFSNNSRRFFLTTRFKALIEKFSELGLAAEIWIDGSYSTLKPEPGDIDIVFFCDPKELNSLPIEKQFLISELFNRDLSKIRYNCDVFLAPHDNTEMRSYWRGWFAFTRDEKPKGIPKINYAIN